MLGPRAIWGWHAKLAGTVVVEGSNINEGCFRRKYNY